MDNAKPIQPECNAQINVYTEGEGGGVLAKVRHLNTSAVPSLGNLTTNFAPLCGHLNLTVQRTGSI